MKNLKFKALLFMSIAIGLMFMSCEKSTVTNLENNIEGVWETSTGFSFLFQEGTMYDGPTVDPYDIETNYLIKPDSILLFFDENGDGNPDYPIEVYNRFGLEFIDNNTMWWTQNGQVTNEFTRRE